MKLYKLDHMVKGWFVGNFDPVAYKTEDAEVSVKFYKKGDKEARHVHKLTTEITVIISGAVVMNNVKFMTNDIIVIEPNESTDFEVIEDTTTVVFKSKSIIGDKYPVQE